MNIKRQFIFGLIYTIAFGISGCKKTHEISQWRGPDRNGIYKETNLLKTWPENGPELIMQYQDLPDGHSSVTATENALYTTGLVDSTDMLIALNHQGKLLWKTAFGRAWNGSFPESRSTPTFYNTKLYVASGYGDIVCLDANDGSIIWKVQAYDKFNGKTGEWGYAESLLIHDEKVFFTVGGQRTTMVALDLNTGKTVWKSKSLNDYSAYVSPIIIHENNMDIIINVLANNLIGINAKNGEILFHTDYGGIDNENALKIWPGAPFTNTISPLYYDHEIYVTSGYNHVGVKFSLKNDFSKAEVSWIDTVLDVHHGGAVLIDGYIYGSNWINNGMGNWCCINWETGEIMYETKWINKGSIISAEGMLYCYDEKHGNIALVKVNPEKFQVVSSFKVPFGSGPHWSHPVIKNGVLYVRHGGALMAYDIKENNN